jgi:hypothetical protein
LDELDDRGRLGLQQAFHDQLVTRIHHSNRDGGLMNVHADILILTHKGAPFARLAMRTISTYRKNGRPFLLRVMAILRQQPAGLYQVSGFH